MDSVDGGELGMSGTLNGNCGLNLGMEKMEPFKELDLCIKDANVGETSNVALKPKGGEFQVSDLVWGKVKGYPWWPGQIVEPSTTSTIAKTTKGSYLIAYFNDDSVLWSKAAKIKPFEMYFSRMSKESNDEAFCQAVNCALEEYSRRVQVGLACPCLPEDALGKVGLTNSGVRELPTGGGSCFAAAFQPEEIVTYLQTLAKSPQAACDALKLVTAKAHLSSFYRRKGYNELPCIEHFDLGEDPDSGDDTGLHGSLKENDLGQMIDRKRKSPSTDLDQPEPLRGSKSQEEPAYPVPVCSSDQGRPQKAVVEKAKPRGEAKKLDFISAGSCSKFQNGQKEPACFVESRISPLIGQKEQENPPTTEWLWDAAEELKKRESEAIGKEAYLEEMKKELASLEETLRKKESELVDKENKLEEMFGKWEHDLEAKEITLNRRELELRAAGKAVENSRKKLVAYTDKVQKLWLEYCHDTEKGKRSREELVRNGESCDAEMDGGLKTRNVGG